MPRPPKGEAQPPGEASRSLFPMVDHRSSRPKVPDRSRQGDSDKIAEPRRGELDSMASSMSSQVKLSGPLTSTVVGMSFAQLSPETNFNAMSSDELTYLREELERSGVKVDFVEGHYVCREK